MHTHTQACRHTHTHACGHIHTRARARTHSRTHSHTHLHSRTYELTHTHALTHTPTHTRTRARAYRTRDRHGLLLNTCFLMAALKEEAEFQLRGKHKSSNQVNSVIHCPCHFMSETRKWSWMSKEGRIPGHSLCMVSYRPEIWPWTRKFLRRSCGDPKLRPFNHEHCALTTRPSPLQQDQMRKEPFLVVARSSIHQHRLRRSQP